MALSGILISLATTIYIFLPDLVSLVNPKDSKFIGLVIKGEGDLRMRFGESINWKKIQHKDKIYTQTYLFTGPKSSATYGFLDESTISLGENSLIYMDFKFNDEGSSMEPDDSVALELVEGEMQINLKNNSAVKKIKVEQAMIDVTKDQRTVIKLNYNENQGLDVSVIQGDINIKQKNINYNVKQGEKVGISNAPNSEPVPEAIDEKTMEEIRRLAEEDHKKVIEDIKKKRQISNIISAILKKFKE